jgi:outer membrane protein assembly factor BamB
MARKASLLLALSAVGSVAVGGAWSARAPVSKGPPPCREAALVSLGTGKVLRRFSARISAVGPGYKTGPLLPGTDAVSDGRGGWFLAGHGLERLRGDGRLDPSWRAQVPPQQWALLGRVARVGDRLYVSGQTRVMAFDASSGAPLWTSAEIGLGPDRRNGIAALAATRTTVYIGGAFSRVGSARRSHVAAFNAITGHLLPWRAPPVTFSEASFPVVSTIAVSRARLYIGGSFAEVGGVARTDGVAAVRRSDGGLTPFAPRSRIWNLSTIVASGRRVLIGGPEGGGVFDSGTGARSPGFAALAHAGAITVHGSTAYLGGNMRTSIGAHELLATDLRTGKPKPWFPNIARYVSVGTIALSAGKAFVGGQFCSTLG